MSNPFQSWTEADVAAFNARGRLGPIAGWPIGGAPERDLHEQIFNECRRRGWIAFHGSMSERTARTLGEPDYQILADCGRVFLIECKTAKAKLRPEQLAIKCWAEKLGHTVHVVRSFEQFLQIVGQ